MRQGWLWLIAGGVLVVLIGLIVGLYLLGDSDQAPLERFRDISVVFLSLGLVMVVLLVGVLVGVGVWVGLLIKDKVIPLLEQLTATAARLRGTTEFVSEEVASPIISAYSSVAGIRALIKTVAGRPKQSRASASKVSSDETSS